jgi:hypothetical protein
VGKEDNAEHKPYHRQQPIMVCVHEFAKHVHPFLACARDVYLPSCMVEIARGFWQLTKVPPMPS